jgi:hypothetical protein
MRTSTASQGASEHHQHLLLVEERLEVVELAVGAH